MINKSVSLVVPVYNEKGILKESVDIFASCLATISKDYEIILVDDGSNDGTVEIIKKLMSSKPNIKAIFNNRNRGSGISLWRGFQEAQKELVVSNFADRPFDLQELNRIIPLFDSEDVDFVVVVRKNRSANTFYRKVTSYVNFLLIKLLFGIPINDFQFVQIYRRNILQGIPIDSTGTFVPPELMIRLINKGFRHKEVTSVFYGRNKGKSKCGDIRVIANSLYEMFHFGFYYRFSIKG